MASKLIMKPIENSIKQKIIANMNPFHYEIINESYKHNVPKDSETHFKVIIVSDIFNDKNLVQRHRMVNTLLAEELQANVHALSITAKTIKQWEGNNTVHNTPNCQGGGKL